MGGGRPPSPKCRQVLGLCKLLSCDVLDTGHSPATLWNILEALSLDFVRSYSCLRAPGWLEILWILRDPAIARHPCSRAPHDVRIRLLKSRIVRMAYFRGPGCCSISESVKLLEGHRGELKPLFGLSWGNTSQVLRTSVRELMSNTWCYLP